MVSICNMVSLANIEFYNTPDGSVMYKENGQPVKQLSENDRGIIESMLGVLRNRYPIAFSRLAELYSRYERNRVHFEFMMVHRFIRCNFGEYDQFKYDIDRGGTFCFEEVRCPLRGECQHEGVICKPELDTKLTDREMEVFALIGESMDTMAIAEELHISPATVNRHRENIKAKLSLKNVKEMIHYYLTQMKK